MEVKADRDRLKQVLLNLIDNAVKYSEPHKPVALKIDQLGEQVTIQVWDKGTGIPLLQQARIIERFYRVDEARAVPLEGVRGRVELVRDFCRDVLVHPGKSN